MIFCGLNLHAPVPDETTHCRFRNALVKGGVYDDLLAEVCRQIEAHGLKLKEAEAAIIDATLEESAARPRTHIDAPEDRAEGEAPDDPQMYYSADPDARWVKKGPNPHSATRPLPARMRKDLSIRSTPPLPTRPRAPNLKP
ncbi:transposase [Rhodobacterales bacterium FZCC0083]|nr:transposase [Rhodobacterales bacterium FZCC0083]